MAKIFCLFFVILFLSCSADSAWIVSNISNPSGENSGESYLFVDTQGEVFLSWIDLEDDTMSQLRFSHLKGGEFKEAQTIAEGNDWFVNWADFPSITKFPNTNKWLAHWLQKSASGTYDYDVRTSIGDGNGNWSSPAILHNDGVATEHGFASIVPYEDNLIAIWLDGRHMTKEEGANHDAHGHGSGAMTLRTAVIDDEHNVTQRLELDNQVCECCQTDIAITQDGPIAVYRNKTDENIRDIYYTRAIDNEWTIPKPVYADNWKISGCPVNGPRIAARKNNVAVAWYSGADQKVKAVYSEDNGKTFSVPVEINTSETIGRVDVAYLGDKHFVVSYMTPKEESAEIKLVELNHDQGIISDIVIDETSSSRASGFPRMATHDQAIYVSYTYVDSTYQQVRTKRVNI